MDLVQVGLIITGILCVIVSILFDRGNDKEEEAYDALVSTDLTTMQKENISIQINKLIESEIEQIKEDTEAELDKISNTKILEFDEYTNAALGEINKNHNEVVFLYDMLNEKSKELKTTVKDVNNTKKQVEKMHAEVKVSEVTEAVSEPDRTADDKAAAYEQGTDSSKNTKDIAKERLMALVKKSNEQARMTDGSPKKENQAEGLKEEAEKNTDSKALDAKASASKTSSAKTTARKKTTRKTAKSAQSKESVEDILKNVQFEAGETNNQKILKLNELGVPVKDIAKQLNLGVGEVKLVIDLYKGGN